MLNTSLAAASTGSELAAASTGSELAGQLDRGRPVPTEAAGVYLFPQSFEDIVGALRVGIGRLAEPGRYRAMAIPPVISRAMIERAGYVSAFPQLLGTVHSYAGDARSWAKLSPLVAAGGDWHADQQVSDLVLLPATCYPVYAGLAGAELVDPVRFAVSGTCFRQEATSEPGRLRSFRMAEYVTAGPEAHCLAWRAEWLDTAGDWLTGLGLEVAVEVADDPFFGPARKLYQAAQRSQELKLELKVAVDPDKVQAVASANYHKDHFGEGFDFRFAGALGHTACMAFGLERIALALITRHGERLAGWPPDVRRLLDH